VLELYDLKQHRELFLHFSYDPAVTAGVVSSCSLWLAGWPDQARSRLQRSLSWAKELGHPFSLVYGLMMGTIVRLCYGDLDDAERLAAEGEKVAHKCGTALFRVIGRILQANIEVQREKAEVGLSVLTEGLSQYRSMGARYLVPLFLCFVAEAYRQMGRVEEGLATIAEAVHLTETRADLFWAAEVYRLQGELTLAQSSVQKNQKSKIKRQKSGNPNPQSAFPNPQSEAEAYFQKALKVAHSQGAKSLELRAAMSLARLWQQQGKQHTACKLLAESYGWFTEGFETKDLREARILLEELSQ
jgi:predicted ATPase